MATIELTDTELGLLDVALSIARERWEEDAVACKGIPMMAGLEEAFRGQVRQGEVLALKLATAG